MNKKDLYYIVIEGTNNRTFNEARCPIIFQHDFVDEFVFKANDVFAKHNYVKISIEEYEQIFGESLEY